MRSIGLFAILLALAVPCLAGQEPGTASTSPFLDSVALAAASTPYTATLQQNRLRLLQDWAVRMGYANACKAWNNLTCQQRGAFLTLTHRMQIYKLAATNDSPLDHVTALYGIAPQGGCGGDGNRIFFSMDTPLWVAMYNTAHEFGDMYIVDSNGNSGWNESHDANGPHPPFNLSDENAYGHPRGQIHFFDYQYEIAVCKTGFGPSQGYGCVEDPRLAELDQDYNWIHDSSTECTYTDNARGCTGTGRQYYEWEHPYIPGIGQGPDYNWAPPGCSTGACGDCTTCLPPPSGFNCPSSVDSVNPVICRNASGFQVSCTCGVATCENRFGDWITCPTQITLPCGACTPSCAGRVCGAKDSCGVSKCTSGSGCIPLPCAPQCAGKVCGEPDGCQGTCKRGSGCAGDGSLNLILPASVQASGYGTPPQWAIDRTLTTAWTGYYPPQWIEIDLGRLYTLEKVRLNPKQEWMEYPRHEILAGPNPAPTTLLARIEVNTFNGQWLTWSSSGVANVRYVRIRSPYGNEATAWYEIEVYGDLPSCSFSLSPSALTIGAGSSSGPLTTITVSPSGCGTWTVTGVPSWLTVSPLSGTATKNLTYSATANGASARTANLTIGGRPFTLTQQAAACTPNCTGRTCGPDANGCGVSCGTCPSGQTCNAAGTCEACAPNCIGRTCGPDANGCGVSCGTCLQGQICNASGTCEMSCGTCYGLVCGGTDSCGQVCCPGSGCYTFPSCREIGGFCQFETDCCSGVCLDGICSPCG